MPTQFLVSKFLSHVHFSTQILQGRLISSAQTWGVVCYTAFYSSELNNKEVIFYTYYLNYSPSCVWHVKHLWREIEIPGTQAVGSIIHH